MVRVFNAIQADFEKQLSVLEAFSHIKLQWQAEITRLIVEYKKIRAAQLKESLQLLEELLTKLCTYQVSQKVLSRN